MKKSLLFVLCVLLSVATSFGQDLVLTAVYDGPLTGGVPKGIELYAINDIADLSQYGLANATNGNPSDGAPEFTFDAQAVTAGTFLYVSSEVDGFTSFFGFAPNATSSVCNINGDDCIELYYNGNIIDVFGEVGVDGSGTAWEYLDGWAYRLSNTSATGSTFDINNWSFSGTNALDNETENATSTTPIPVGTYTTGGTVEEYAKVPTFTPEGGLYTNAQSVEIATETEGASIYYTIDGTEPTESSTEYTSAISISQNTTLKAIAVKEGMNNSSVATATYTFIVEVSSIAEFLLLDEGAVAKLTGEVVSVDVNESYGTVTSLVVTDGTDELTVYGVFRISDVVYEVGQTLILIGERDSFNGADQMSFSSNSGHSIVIDSASGIDKTKEKTVKIVPNPFSTEFRVDGDVVSVTLYNAAGQLVKNVPAVAGVVSTSDLSKGMYILQVKLADGTVSTQKVIKK